MKKINLKTVCDSDLITELEERGFYVQYISKNINDWKLPNKIIEFEAEHDYWYLGETKEFTKDEFEKTIREFLSISDDDVVEIFKEYFRLKSLIPTVVVELVKCKKEDEGAIEFWGI